MLFYILNTLWQIELKKYISASEKHMETQTSGKFKIINLVCNGHGQEDYVQNLQILENDKLQQYFSLHLCAAYE